MDDPSLAPRAHDGALRGLARINAVSMAAAPLARAVRACVPPGTVRVLDVATGSGDVSLALARRLERAGYAPEFVLTDRSSHALQRAGERFGRAGLRVEALELDALRDPLPPADVVLCTLFLHHLGDDDVTALLGALARAARRAVVVIDLARSRTGTMLARVVPRLVTRSHVVHVDAVISARAAFTPAELGRLADGAGLRGHGIGRVFPCRMLLTWRAEAPSR